MNRESWLTELADRIVPLFRGFKVSPYRLTCGWPSRNGLGRRRRVVGECFGAESSTGGVHELFISPLLEGSLEVAGTVCHELAHVAAGVEARHGHDFVRVCRHVGLTKGKPQTVMPGPRLEEALGKIVETIGPYPHTALKPKLKLVEVRLTTLKLRCSQCGCTVTMSLKWLNQAGEPTCGCGGSMEIAVD